LIRARDAGVLRESFILGCCFCCVVQGKKAKALKEQKG